jgi:hypothetical protein
VAAWLSRDGGHFGDVVPYAKGIVTGGTMFAGGQPVTAKLEEVVDPAVGGEKLLRMAALLKRFMCRSRRRVGWCDTSVQLLR